MYQSIYNYALNHGLVPIRGKVYRNVAAHIDIRSSEEDYEIFYSEKERPKDLCPYMGTRENSYAPPLCSKVMYIFPTDEESEKYQNQCKSWIESMEDCAEHDVPFSKEIVTFCRYAKESGIDAEIRQALADNKIKDKDFISFSIKGKSVLHPDLADAWTPWFDDYMSRKFGSGDDRDIPMVISAISGKEVVPVIKPEDMARVSGAGKDRPIIQFDKDSFKSYGFEQNLNCPVSKEEGYLIKAGIEHLYNSPSNHYGAPFNILYWYDSDSVNDLFGNTLNADANRTMDENANKFKSRRGQKKHSTDPVTREKNYEEVLASVFKNKHEIVQRENGNYHLILYNFDSDGRVYLQRERSGSYNEVYNNLSQWYADAALEFPFRTRTTLCNIYGILLGLMNKPDAKQRNKQIKAEFGANIDGLIRSIFEGEKVPEVFFQRSIEKLEKEIIHGCFGGDSLDAYMQLRIPMEVIKVSLIRKGVKMEDSFNKMDEVKSAAYQCGRVLAVCDEIQNKSLYRQGKHVAHTVGEQKIKQIQAYPERTMGDVLADVIQVYIPRLDGKTAAYWQQLLSGINDLAISFANSGEHLYPEKFTEADRAAFLAGYISQKGYFITRRREQKALGALQNEPAENVGTNNGEEIEEQT